MLRVLACVVLALPLTAQSWVDRTGPTGPTPRQGHAMCYDAARGYVMMAGGWPQVSSGSMLEVWTWDGTNWTRRTPGGTPNTNAPLSVTLSFHAATNEVLMVLGLDTYTWDGTDWSYRGRAAVGSTLIGNTAWPMALAFDPVRNQSVLFLTKRYDGLDHFAETYVWDGLGWLQRNTAVRPIGDAAGMSFDPSTQRLLLCTNQNGSTWFWEWTGSNWQQRYFGNAPAVGGAMTTDTARGKVVMLDAELTSTPNHTWSLANGQAVRLSTAVEPARRVRSAMAFDTARGCCVLFGGSNGGPNELADTWEFTLGAGASYSTFGVGCAGSRGVPVISAQGSSLPRIGQSFELHVGNLPFTGPVFVFLGLSNTAYGPTPLPFPLGVVGAPNCSLLVSGDELRSLTNVLGTAVWQWQVPNFPGITFYNQAFAFDPAANALGLTVSNGGQGTIGF